MSRLDDGYGNPFAGGCVADRPDLVDPQVAPIVHVALYDEVLDHVGRAPDVVGVLVL